MRERCSYYGNPWIGMFVKASDSMVLAPLDCPDKLAMHLAHGLKAEVKRTSIGDSNLVGVYLAMNSSGIVVPNITTPAEVSALRALGLNVYHSQEKQNAHGNNLAINDKGGVVNPHIHAIERKRMEDALGIELVPMRIADYATVGSSCLVGNKGFLAHYSASDADMKALESALRVKGERGTVNMGTGFVSFGVVANRHGYAAGEATSAHELGRMESALGYV
jgi:translation initiation factor 6